MAPATIASPISRNAGAGTGVADGGVIVVGTGVGAAVSASRKVENPFGEAISNVTSVAVVLLTTAVSCS